MRESGRRVGETHHSVGSDPGGLHPPYECAQSHPPGRWQPGDALYPDPPNNARSNRLANNTRITAWTYGEVRQDASSSGSMFHSPGSGSGLRLGL